MSEITTLQPQLLWKWFDQICAIPHPSHHEDAQNAVWLTFKFLVK